MAYKLIIKDEVKLDTEDVYNYYENKREGLGEKFLQELAEAYDRLSTHPQHYGFVNDQYFFRTIKIDRFPYSILYKIIEDSVIVYKIHNTHTHLKRRAH